jgi:hypothetical protein
VEKSEIALAQIDVERNNVRTWSEPKWKTLTLLDEVGKRDNRVATWKVCVNNELDE